MCYYNYGMENEICLSLIKLKARLMRRVLSAALGNERQRKREHPEIRRSRLSRTKVVAAQYDARRSAGCGQYCATGDAPAKGAAFNLEPIDGAPEVDKLVELTEMKISRRSTAV